MYGLTVWGSSPYSHLDRLVKLQKKAVRHVALAKYNSHTEPLMKKLNILNLNDSYKLQCCKLFYKQKHGNLHPYHSARLLINSQQHSTLTRQSLDVSITRWTKNVQKQMINYKIGTIWNSLPREIKEHKLISEYTFAKKLKRYFLSLYKEICEIHNCYICKRINGSTWFVVYMYHIDLLSMSTYAYFYLMFSLYRAQHLSCTIAPLHFCYISRDA